MQEQIEARAALNGGGAGHELVPKIEAEAANATLPVRAGLKRSPVWAVVGDEAGREELRRRVTETTDSMTAIAKDYRVSPQTLTRAIAPFRWPRPPGAPPPPSKADGTPLPGKRLAADIADTGMVKARLLRALDRQIDKVDGRIRKKGAEVEEKDARILSNLAKTLSTLMQMGESGKTSNDAEPPDRDEDAEERLAERIKRWARGEQGY